MRYYFIFATIAAIASAAPASGASIYDLNGGFESGGLSPWFQDREINVNFLWKENWNVTSADAHSGTYSATCMENLELRQNLIPVPTSQIASISFWVRHPNDPGPTAYDFFYTDSTSTEYVVFPATTDWEFFDVTSSLMPGKTLSAISFWGFGMSENSRTRLDNLQIIVVPEPSVPGLASMGIIAWIFLASSRRIPNRSALRRS
jgi:hypothetical protein